MKVWDAAAVIKAIDSVPGCSSSQWSGPEDYTSGQIVVLVNTSQHSIYVRGFRTDGEQFLSDNQVEMVEVTTGYSDGDMPNDPDYCVTVAMVKAAIMRLGYQVVNSMDGYF